MKKKETLRKNYAILIGMILLVIVACAAFYNLYTYYNDSQIASSPLKEDTKEISYKEVTTKLSDLEADTILVISYNDNDKKIYKNEKDIKKYLRKNDLLDNVMYLDMTEYKDNENFIDELNNKLNLTEKKKINSLPAIIYYKDGKVSYVKDSKKNILSVDDFEQLVDMYELAS